MLSGLEDKSPSKMAFRVEMPGSEPVFGYGVEEGTAGKAFVGGLPICVASGVLRWLFLAPVPGVAGREGPFHCDGVLPLPADVIITLSSLCLCPLELGYSMHCVCPGDRT